MFGFHYKDSVIKIILNSDITADWVSTIFQIYCLTPSITDGVHRNKNFEEIIPVFSTFSNFFKLNKKKI